MEQVTDEQIKSARERAGYNSEDLKKEVNAVLQNVHEEEHEYLSLSEEQKKKLQDAKNRVVDIEDEDDLSLEDDPVNNPSHYQSMSSDANIDCITAMRAAFGDYEVSVWCLINSFKYIYRCNSKGGNDDIKKAIWYLNKFLELGGCDQ